MLSVSVVIPTYNERENIPILARRIHEVLAGRTHEILVVDDSSPDGTGEAVRGLSKEIGVLRLLSKERKEGIGAALRHGYDGARCEVLVSIDADLSFDPADIPRFLRLIEDGCDLVVGSRHMPEGSYEAAAFGVRIKKCISAWGNRFVRALLGLPVRDCSANFRAMRRTVWTAIDTQDNSNSLLLEMILKAVRAGFKVAELPVAFKDRLHGTSKLNLALELPRYFARLVVHTARFRLLSR